MRLYDEEIYDDNEKTIKSLNGEELRELERYRNDVYLHKLYVYYLDREDPKMVQPKLVRTIELEDQAYHYVDDNQRWADPTSKKHPIMDENFCICGNVLGISKMRFGKLEFEFYDMENWRNVEADLIYKITNISSVALKSGTENEGTNIGLKQFRIFFEANFFIFSRDDGHGKYFVEIHEISSKMCKLVRKIELKNDFGHFDDLYIESLGRFTWNLYISAGRTPETSRDMISVNEIVFIDKCKNIVTKNSERKNSNISGKLHEIVSRVEKQMTKEAVYGHVRMHESNSNDDDFYDENYEIHLKFYA